MTARLTLAATIAVFLALLSPAPEAAEITVVNMDDPGEGFNNLLAVSPVAGISFLAYGTHRWACT